MRRSMLRMLLATLGAMVAALVAVPFLVVTVPANPTLVTYTYDDHHRSELVGIAVGRGPPGHGSPTTAYDAVGTLSHGASARPIGPTALATHENNDPASLVQPARASGSTPEQVQRPDWQLSSLPRTGVAANTVRRTSYPVSEAGAPLAGNRVTGINRARAQERDLLHAGGGTRDWTADEARALWLNGQVKGYTGHHINSVDAFPEWAGDPRNIRFLKNNGSRGGINEHLYSPLGHGGAWQNATSGNLIDRLAMIANLGGR